METLPQRKYPKEFSELAAQLVHEEEPAISKATRGLSMSAETVTGMDSPASLATDFEDEVPRLKRELAEARMECKILKQTVAYFAKAKLSDGGS